MKKLLFLLVFSALASCLKKPVIKNVTRTIYSTKKELGEYMKDTIIEKYSYGFYPNGADRYNFTLIDEYSRSSKDTTWHNKTNIIIEDNKVKYFVDDSLIHATVKKKDTLYYYSQYYGLDKPYYSEIFDEIGRIKQWVSYNRKSKVIEKHTVIKPKYDKHGELIYSLVRRELFYDFLDEAMLSDFIIINEIEYY